MFAPDIPLIMREFHDDTSITATFLLSIYVLGFAFGSLLVAPISEVYGRRQLCIYGNILFTGFTVGAALSKNMCSLLAFRLLMGLTGVVPLTIGSGSIADMMPKEKRGRAVSIWALGPLLGPLYRARRRWLPHTRRWLEVGILAYRHSCKQFCSRSHRLASRLTHSLFQAGVFIPVSIVGLRETYPPTLLEQRVRRLQKETGNKELHSRFERRGSMSN